MDSDAAERTEQDKMVEVEVELPVWLDEQATAHNLDLSVVLQDALKQQLELPDTPV